METPSPARSLIGLLAVAASVLGAGEADGQMRFDPRFGVDRWSTEDGLPGQAITSLGQTGDGYLWMVASGILVRFDGVRVQAFPPGASGSPTGRILSLVAGAGDTLWVTALDQGYTTLARHAGGRFEPILRFEGGWSQVARESDGTLWLGGISKMVRVVDGALRDTVPIGMNIAAMGFGAEAGPTVWRDGSGDLWTRDDGTRSLLRLEAGGPRSGGPAHAPILLTRPSTGEVLLSESRGGRMEIRDREGRRLASYPDRGSGVPLIVDRRGRLWVLDEGVLVVYGAASEDPVARVGLPADVDVVELIEDHQGNLWGRTVTSGLIRIRELPFHVVGPAEGIRARQVLNLAPGRGGSVLASDRDGRSYRIGAEGVEVVYEFGDHEGSSGTRGGAHGLGEDRNGRLWFGTGGRTGPDTRHLVGRRTGWPDVVLPIRLGVRTIQEDPRGNGVIWFGGVMLYQGRLTDDGVELTDSILLATEDLRSMAFDGEGGLWLPVDGGLARVEDGRLDLIAGAEYPGRSARSLLFGPEGGLWIGTYGAGVLRYRDGVFSSVTQADGLFEDVASTLLADDYGNLWMAGNRSIHRVGFRELNAFMDGERERVVGIGYSRDQGIPNPETSGYRGARDAEGRLWFPTFGGAVMVDPSTLFALDAGQPPAHVEGVVVGGRSEPIIPEMLDGFPSVELSPEERRFDIGFTAIDLRDPEGVRFRYLLEGFDEGWTEAGTARSATYTNVGAGSYTFRVRATSSSGIESEEASLRLVVAPFFHETTPFRAAVFLTLVAALLALFRYRERQARIRQTHLNQLVVDRTRELSEASVRTEEALELVRAQATRLESLDRARSRFFANVSHEFRTPLTLMVGPLRDLRNGRLGALPAEAEAELDVVLESGERLTSLVDQLLDIARLEVGELRLELASADLRPLLNRVVRSFDALARTRELEFTAEIPSEPILLNHDPDRLEKVLNNLLGNAFKFTPAGGEVLLRVSVEEGAGGEGRVRIEVEDSGVGISPEDLDRVFDRFYQADDSPKRRYGGAGVGLALSRELVELHGGEILLSSAVGEGTLVTVHLPLGDPGLAAASTPATPTRPVGAVLPLPAGLFEDPADPMTEDVTTVLVVDDERRMRQYLRRHLETEYRVVEAADGVEALAAARRLVPDLVVSDVMMPRMDGEELVAAIRADPEVAFLPVILLTARASHEDLLSGLEGGADDYITKPFDVEEVLLRARNLIQSRRRLRERLRDGGLVIPTAPPPGAREGETAAFVAEVYDVLRERALDEDFDVDVLAASLHTSRSALYRRSQALLGHPPMELVWTYRLEQAARWLRETEVRVNEIAYGVGFKSVPHFSRKFRERYGVTPSRYRGDGEEAGVE